jgi:2-polyprenyl-3-methyl-5-hydroxy-6-metoxy-1,4-benzoquinol methylase
MGYEGLSNLYLLAGADNYNAWLFDAIKPYIGRRVLEVGAGIGTFTSYLLDREHVTAADLDEACLGELSRRFSGVGNVEVMRMDVAAIGAEQMEMLSRRMFDTVVSMNVLEHIEDDRLALKNLRSLVSAGHLLLVVPALPVLYGVEDREVGHYRRYAKKELIDKLSGAGWRVERIHYLNSVGAVLWLVKNRIMKSPVTSPVNVRIYDKLIVPFLSKLENFIPVPFGQSLVAISSSL